MPGSGLLLVFLVHMRSPFASEVLLCGLVCLGGVEHLASGISKNVGICSTAGELYTLDLSGGCRCCSGERLAWAC